MTKGKRIGVIACDGNFTFDREPPPMEDIFPTGYVANALIFSKVAEKKLGLFTVMFNSRFILNPSLSRSTLLLVEGKTTPPNMTLGGRIHNANVATVDMKSTTRVIMVQQKNLPKQRPREPLVQTLPCSSWWSDFTARDDPRFSRVIGTSPVAGSGWPGPPKASEWGGTKEVSW